MTARSGRKEQTRATRGGTGSRSGGGEEEEADDEEEEELEEEELEGELKRSPPQNGDASGGGHASCLWALTRLQASACADLVSAITPSKEKSA